MAQLLQISDTHFGTEQGPVVTALIALAHALRPDVLVFSGDVTQRARRGEFDAARRLVEAMAIPRVLVLPGNHDIPLFDLVSRALRPYAEYVGAFGETLDPVLATDDFFIVGVNTTRPSRHKNGEVSREQTASSSDLIRTARPSQLRVIVTHQPADIVRPQDADDRLRGAEAALHAWSQAGVDIVLGGHIHLPYLKALHRRQEPTSRRMWCVQAGTAVSSRVRHGTSNSVNLLRWEQPRALDLRACGLERWDYSAATRRFEQVEATTLELD